MDIIEFLCSYNIDKLASSCYILFSSCGTKNEIFRAQAFWAESSDGIWNSKWNLDWVVKFESGFQFCWILSGIFLYVFYFSKPLLLLFGHFYQEFFNRLFYICIQMTKLAIIPCTILLEILFLGKKFRSHLASYRLYTYGWSLDIYIKHFELRSSPFTILEW